MLEDLKLDPLYDGFLFLCESVRNPPKLNSHHHVELELNVVLRGSITYVVRGQRFTFPRRSLLWMFPSQEHQLVDRSDDAQNYVAVFKPDLIAQSCRSEAYAGLKRKKIKGGGLLHTLLDPESFDLVCKTMDAVMLGSLDADLLNREAGFGVASEFRFAHSDPDGLNAGLHHLLLLCWRLQRKTEVSGEPVQLHPAVCKALTLLSEDVWEKNLSYLARKCGVSETYLSRIFCRQIGVPLNRYRNSLRLARFWEEYRQPVQRTISEAVYAAGFGSYAQFFKVFTETYGRGPRESLQSKLVLPS